MIDSDTVVIAGIVLLIIAFGGEPDLMDALVHYLMDGNTVTGGEGGG